MKIITTNQQIIKYSQQSGALLAFYDHISWFLNFKQPYKKDRDQKNLRVPAVNREKNLKPKSKFLPLNFFIFYLNNSCVKIFSECNLALYVIHHSHQKYTCSQHDSVCINILKFKILPFQKILQF